MKKITATTNRRFQGIIGDPARPGKALFHAPFPSPVLVRFGRSTPKKGLGPSIIRPKAKEAHDNLRAAGAKFRWAVKA